MKRFVFTIVCALGITSLVGCSKDNLDPSSGISATTKTTKVTEREAFRLSLDLSPEFVQDKARSLGFDTNDQIMESTDWSGELFLRKEGDNTVYRTSVSFTATKSSKGYTLKAPSQEYTFYTTSGQEATVPDFSDSDNWYVSAIIGGGTYNASSHSVSFSESDDLIGKQGEKFTCPYITRWSKATIEGPQRLHGSLKFEIAGTLIKLTVTNKLHSVLYNEVYFKSTAISPIGQFNFGESLSTLDGVRPSFTFSGDAEYSKELVFDYVAKSASDVRYIWGIPRTGVSNPYTTVEGPIEMKIHPTSDTNIDNAYRSAKVPNVNTSFPLNLTASANPKANNVLTYFAPGFLNADKNGFVDPTSTTANHSELYAFITGSDSESSSYTNRTINGVKYKLPTQPEATMLLQPYNESYFWPSGIYQSSNFFGSSFTKPTGDNFVFGNVGQGYTYTAQDYNYEPRKEVVEIYGDRFGYYADYVRKAGDSRTETTYIYGIRFANKGVGTEMTNDDNGQTGRNYRRTAFRYVRNATTPATENNSDGGRITIQTVIIGHSPVTLADIQNESWWTTVAPTLDDVHTITIPAPGYFVNEGAWENDPSTPTDSRKNRHGFSWIQNSSGFRDYSVMDFKDGVLSSSGSFSSGQLATLLYILDLD